MLARLYAGISRKPNDLRRWLDFASPLESECSEGPQPREPHRSTQNFQIMIPPAHRRFRRITLPCGTTRRQIGRQYFLNSFITCRRCRIALSDGGAPTTRFAAGLLLFPGKSARGFPRRSDAKSASMVKEVLSHRMALPVCQMDAESRQFVV